MTAGLTLAGGSAVARSVLVYRPTTELVVQSPTPNRGGGGGGGFSGGGADSGAAARTSASTPWSQRKKQTPASGVEPPPPEDQQSQLSGTGSAHSTLSSPTRVRRTGQSSAIPTTLSSPLKTSGAGTKPPTAGGQTRRSSSSQPPDSRLSTPPRRRLVVNAAAANCTPAVVATGATLSSPEKVARNRNVSPKVAKTSPVKQRPPPVAIFDADTDDVTSIGSHCMLGVPKKTSQSLRLVRILLNQPTLRSVTKLYVNQAIQKHMHTLKELQSTRQAKQILETQLEIAKTESDIAKAATAAAEERLKSVKWKLAKERQATKDKLEAAAATMAMSSSIAPVAASTANLTDIVALVEKTVVSLRAKEKVLRELNGTAGNDETTAMVEQLELESKLLRQHLDPDGCSEGEDSDSTPIMGHQSFSSLDSKEVMPVDQSAWSKEKRELKREFEETVASAERKIDQLKSVLTVCNERRLRAEQFLTESQKEVLIQFTIENQEQLAHNTSMARSTHGDGIKVECVEIVDDVDDDLESSQLALDVSENGMNIENGNSKQLDSLREKLQSLETQTDLLMREKEALGALLQSAKADKELHQSKAVELENSLLETERKVFDILKIGTVQAIDEANLRTETICEDLAETAAELLCSKNRVLELESELESTRQALCDNMKSMETAIRQQKAIDDELRETKNQLHEVRIELETLKELKQPRQSVIDSRSAVRQAEAKVGEIRARLSLGARPYHSAHSPSKIRSRITAFERLSVSNASSSDDNTESHQNDDRAVFKKVHSFRSQSTLVVESEIPTQDEMDADTAKIAAIHVAFADSQCKVDSLRGADSCPLQPDSSNKALAVHSLHTEESVDKDIEIAELKRRLAEKSQRLMEAEKQLAAFSTETKTDLVEDTRETLRQTLEELKDLKQQALSSAEELHEAQGKLIFLRKVVLSVVPWEEDEEHDDINHGEVGKVLNVTERLVTE